MASCHTHAALLLILPRKPQNSQKFLAEKSLPQMHTDEHSKFAEEYDAVA